MKKLLLLIIVVLLSTSALAINLPPNGNFTAYPNTTSVGKIVTLQVNMTDPDGLMSHIIMYDGIVYTTYNCGNISNFCTASFNVTNYFPGNILYTSYSWDNGSSSRLKTLYVNYTPLNLLTLVPISNYDYKNRYSLFNVLNITTQKLEILSPPQACSSSNWMTRFTGVNSTCTQPNAADISNGTFPTGTYTFRNQLTVGNITYNDTYWDDVAVQSTGLASGAFAPTLTAWNNTGAVPCYAGSVRNEYSYGAVELPHWWKQGTTLYPHIHSSKSSAGDGNYTFNLKYAISNSTYTKYGETNVTVINGGQWLVYINGFNNNIDASEFKIGDMFRFTLTRLQDASNDTYADCVGVFQVSVHAEKDMPGSRDIYTK